MKWTLLYFDDQYQNIEAMRLLLEEEFQVIGTTDAASYPRLLEENNPHAILLDVHMPILDGHELYQRITEHALYNDCPVIFISGDQSDENKIKSFTKGGVDFLARDLKPEELVARLKNKVKFFLDRSTLLTLGNLEIDVATMKAHIKGKQVDLTILEFRILSSILRRYPQFLSRAEMIQKVWGNDLVKPGTVNTHLTHLKQKIEGWEFHIKVRDENIVIQKKDIFSQ